VFLDPALEVAPFGVIPSDLRGKMMLIIENPGFARMNGIVFGYPGSGGKTAKTLKCHQFGNEARQTFRSLQRNMSISMRP